MDMCLVSRLYNRSVNRRGTCSLVWLIQATVAGLFVCCWLITRFLSWPCSCHSEQGESYCSNVTMSAHPKPTVPASLLKRLTPRMSVEMLLNSRYTLALFHAYCTMLLTWMCASHMMCLCSMFRTLETPTSVFVTTNDAVIDPSL